MEIKIMGLEGLADAINNLAKVWGNAPLKLEAVPQPAPTQTPTPQSGPFVQAPQTQATNPPQVPQQQYTQTAPQPQYGQTNQTPVQASQQPQSNAAVGLQGAVPTVAATYKMDDLARAAMTLMDAGKQEELLQLLSGYGVEALPQLPEAQYGAFATALRGLGAQI